MADLQIIYTEEALEDMLDISDDHYKAGETSALRALDALQEHLDKLAQFPRMGEKHPDNYRNALGFRKLVHDNHIVICRIDPAQVIIERIVWASSNYPELFHQTAPQQDMEQSAKKPAPDRTVRKGAGVVLP